MNPSQSAEERLEVLWQVGSAGVGGVHRDEDGHVRVDPHLLAHQLDHHLILLAALRLLGWGGRDSIGLLKVRTKFHGMDFEMAYLHTHLFAPYYRDVLLKKDKLFCPPNNDACSVQR